MNKVIPLSILTCDCCASTGFIRTCKLKNCDYKMCTLYTDDGIGAKPAIDEFLKNYEGEYELLLKKYQVIIKRLK